ncbi:MAG: hypothetical protein ABGY41_02275 [Candidatus Poribacteria bacterium]
MAYLRSVSVWLACATLFALIVDVSIARETVAVEITEVGSGAPYEVGDDLQIGAQYYIDRDYTITTMPAELEGIQWIMTSRESARSSAARLRTFDP